MIANVFGQRRATQIPEFEVWELDQGQLGNDEIATPPPYRIESKLQSIK